jgi:hypothetical protein
MIDHWWWLIEYSLLIVCQHLSCSCSTLNVVHSTIRFAIFIENKDFAEIFIGFKRVQRTQCKRIRVKQRQTIRNSFLCWTCMYLLTCKLTIVSTIIDITQQVSLVRLYVQYWIQIHDEQWMTINCYDIFIVLLSILIGW